MEQNFFIALILTIFAGLSTGIGSLMGLFAKKTNFKFLSLALGFSAGVMLFVSFVDIYPKAFDMIVSIYSDKTATFLTAIAFFTGIILIFLIDKFLTKKMDQIKINQEDNTKKKNNLLKMGIFTALAVGIHNFPEGLVTFIAALSDPSMGISIAIAIAIHNIPEGLAVSIPIYYSTGSRLKAFKYSFFSGIAEPVGAVIGYLVLIRFLNNAFIGFVFAAVAGIMVYISINELIPTAKAHHKSDISLYGLIIGMFVMAISLVLL